MSTISTALSGMNAAWMQIGVSGHNIANTMTPGFHRQQVQQSALPEGGVQAEVSTAAEAGDALAEDIVNQMAASVIYRANAQTLRTQSQLSGSLIDVLA
ncbi:MAG: flagellar basal body rod protein [Piscinibacter sp.]